MWRDDCSMENSALNLAHRERRRGENHTRCGRLEAAAACHERAARLLEKAALDAGATRARESIALQREFHAGQERLLRLQRIQLESYKRALEKQVTMDGIARQQAAPTAEDSASLQTEIARTMDEADLLISRLSRPTSDLDDVDIIDPVSPSTGSRQTQGEDNLVEELRTVNAHLRVLILRLANQLDSAVREADSLRAQLAALRSPTLALPPLPMPDLDFSIFEKHSADST